MLIEVAPVLRSGKAEVDLPDDVASRAAPGMAWSERRPVGLEASEDTKAADLLLAAAEELDLDTSPKAWGWPWWVALSDLSDEPVVIDVELDVDGRAGWRIDPHKLTIGNLEQLTASQVTAGDPHRLFLILDWIEKGGNGLDILLQLHRAVHEAQPYLSDAAKIYGGVTAAIHGVKAYKLVRKKLNSLFHDRGADIVHLQKLFWIPRTTDEAAKLLGLHSRDAPPLLEFLNLHLVDGYWRKRTDPGAAELEAFLAVLHAASHNAMSEPALRRALSQILKLPPSEWADGAEGAIRSAQYDEIRAATDEDQ